MSIRSIKLSIKPTYSKFDFRQTEWGHRGRRFRRDQIYRQRSHVQRNWFSIVFDDDYHLFIYQLKRSPELRRGLRSAAVNESSSTHANCRHTAATVMSPSVLIMNTRCQTSMENEIQELFGTYHVPYHVPYHVNRAVASLCGSLSFSAAKKVNWTHTRIRKYFSFYWTT